jgi:hypothetical protein
MPDMLDGSAIGYAEPVTKDVGMPRLEYTVMLGLAVQPVPDSVAVVGAVVADPAAVIVMGVPGTNVPPEPNANVPVPDGLKVTMQVCPAVPVSVEPPT